MQDARIGPGRRSLRASGLATDTALTGDFAKSQRYIARAKELAREAKADELELLPSEYFRRQVYACYWFEKHLTRELLETLGTDHIMFETDFPHPTCLYPDSLERAAEGLVDIDPAVRKQLLSTNASKLYNIPV